ncbi:hypothetical protein RCL1_001740 [Eukaryota sp. TZLM3-RCL]
MSSDESVYSYDKSYDNYDSESNASGSDSDVSTDNERTDSSKPFEVRILSVGNANVSVMPNANNTVIKISDLPPNTSIIFSVDQLMHLITVSQGEGVSQESTQLIRPSVDVSGWERWSESPRLSDTKSIAEQISDIFSV